MEFPVIVIDSINNSIKSVEDEEDIFIQQSQKDEYPYLEKNSLRIQTHSNNDDGDSGIHESSEVLGPSPVPSHRMLIEPATHPETSAKLHQCKRSLSANSLIERKRSFSQSFIKSAKNRNYSIDAGRQTNLQVTKSFSPYKLMIVDEDGMTILVQKVSRESVKSLTGHTPTSPNETFISQHKEREGQFMNDLCQIHLLLIIMKIVLGASVTVFGIFLKGFSSSLEVKDCGYWASSLLLVSGLISLYFATERLYFDNQRLHSIYLILTVTISVSSSILCMISSVHSGVHGNWISFYADDCTSKRPWLYSDKELICCVDPSTDINVLSSINWNFTANAYDNRTSTCSCIKLGKLHRLYVGFTCKYLFSSLKDYFVLICSLMAIGSGCDLWFVIYLLRHRCTSPERHRHPHPSVNYVADVNRGFSHNQLPSPIIPAVLFPRFDRIQSY